VSHALEMTIHFYYPTLELFCFSFTQPFITQNVVYPTLFSSVPRPAINNDRSLTPYLVNWIISFLENRVQRVIVDGIVTE
jgi:hypothetical protein